MRENHRTILSSFWVIVLPLCLSIFLSVFWGCGGGGGASSPSDPAAEGQLIARQLNGFMTDLNSGSSVQPYLSTRLQTLTDSGSSLVPITVYDFGTSLSSTGKGYTFFFEPTDIIYLSSAQAMVPTWLDFSSGQRYQIKFQMVKTLQGWVIDAIEFQSIAATAMTSGVIPSTALFPLTSGNVLNSARLPVRTDPVTGQPVADFVLTSISGNSQTGADGLPVFTMERQQFSGPLNISTTGVGVSTGSLRFGATGIAAGQRISRQPLAAIGPMNRTIGEISNLMDPSGKGQLRFSNTLGLMAFGADDSFNRGQPWRLTPQIAKNGASLTQTIEFRDVDLRTRTANMGSRFLGKVQVSLPWGMADGLRLDVSASLPDTGEVMWETWMFVPGVGLVAVVYYDESTGVPNGQMCLLAAKVNGQTFGESKALPVSYLVLSSMTPASGPVMGVPFQHTFQASGGTPPYSWGLSTGPSWLSMNPAIGQVTGIPDAPGFFTVGIRVSDSGGMQVRREQVWQVPTPAETVPPVLQSFSPASGAAGVAVNASIVLQFSEPVVSTSVIPRFQLIGMPGGPVAFLPPVVNALGDQVTFQPILPLLPGALYAATLGSGVRDLVGNPSLGATTWTFSCSALPGDTTPPTVAALSPVNNAVNIASNAILVITFNEPVATGTGYVWVKRVADNSIIASLSVTDPSRVMVSGGNVTLDPIPAFESLTAYYVEIANTAFKDAAGNAFSGMTGAASWTFTAGNFTIPDTTPPTVTVLSPVNNAVNIASNAILGITFNEPIATGTGYVWVKRVADNSIIASLSVADPARVSVSGGNVTLDPIPAFESLTAYYVEIANTAFKDAAGNAFSGMTGAASWTFTAGNFTIPDTTPPTVTVLSPVNNAVNIASNAILGITFNEPIATGTGYVWVKRIADNSIIASLSVADLARVTVSGGNVTLDPAPDLESLVAYYVEIPSTAFKDVAGNAFSGMTGAASWTFTAGDFTIPDTTPPTVTALSPVNNAVNIASNAILGITFNEPVVIGTGYVWVKRVADNSIIASLSVADSAQVMVSGGLVNLDPVPDLESLTIYYVEIPNTAFKDAAGNAFSGMTGAASWTFTAGNFTIPDTTPPTVTALSPVNNAVNVASNANLGITFNETVVAGTGFVWVKRVADNSIIASLSVTDAAQVMVSGGLVNLDPVPDLDNQTAFYVEIPNTAFKDVAGNAFSGMTGAASWTFTVADSVAPVISTLSPGNNATAIASNTNLGIIFSENMATGTGYVWIKRVADSSIIASLSVANSAQVSVSGGNVTLDPTPDLESLTSYYVEIANTAFTDLAGNAFVGMTGAASWTFTTADTAPPVINALSPANGASGVASATTLKMTFSEPVFANSGTISLVVASTGLMVDTISVPSAQVVVNQATVTLTLLSNLPNETIAVNVTSDCFRDATGLPFPGITGTTTWAFTVDASQPAIVAFNYLDGQVATSSTDPIILTFNEPVFIGAGSFSIWNSTSGGVFQSYSSNDLASISIVGSQVTIAHLPYSQNQSFCIDLPAGFFVDAAGNPSVAQPQAAPYIIGTDLPPSVNLLQPLNGAQNLPWNPVTLFIQFDEPTSAGTGFITVRNALGAIETTIDVTSGAVTSSGLAWGISLVPTNLGSGTHYVEIDSTCFLDTNGLAFPGITGSGTWSFTMDGIPPFIASVTPANGSIATSSGDPIILQFSEAVNGTSGAIQFFMNGGSNPIFTYAANNTTYVTISGSQVTIVPSGLPGSSLISYSIAAGAFEDAQGVPCLPVSSGTYSFSTP